MHPRLLSISPAAPNKRPVWGGVDARPEDTPMQPFHSRRTDAH